MSSNPGLVDLEASFRGQGVYRRTPVSRDRSPFARERFCCQPRRSSMNLVSLRSRILHLVLLRAGHAVLTSLTECHSSRSRRQRATPSRPRTRRGKTGRTGGIKLGSLRPRTVPRRPDSLGQTVRRRAASFAVTTPPRQTPLSPSLQPVHRFPIYPPPQEIRPRATVEAASCPFQSRAPWDHLAIDSQDQTAASNATR